MGNDSSKPINERIHIAVVEDNPTGIQALVESLPNYPAHDTNQLQWLDKRGRTPLIVAAKRGYLKCANLLLQNGADVNFMNRFPETRGTALHEAIHEKHERMSELLLISGANPFLANSYGSTALDVALQVNFGPMIQRLKAMALHVDTASFKVPTYGGLSSAFKPKFLVLVPYHPFAKSNGQKVTKQLLIFNDAKSTTTRSRIWLHGISLKAVEGGSVRLHLLPSHPHPGDDFVTTFDRGHCLFMKEENPTPAAMERFKKLIAILKESSAATTKAQSNDSLALKSDASAASFNSSGTLTDSGGLCAMPALNSKHSTDNSGAALVEPETHIKPAEHCGASPAGQCSPSLKPQQQQLQLQQEDQKQSQQQPAQLLTPFSPQQKPNEHHASHTFSDPHAFQPPSGVSSACSTPLKGSSSIWNKSGDAGTGSMKHSEQAMPGKSDADFASRLAHQESAPSPSPPGNLTPAEHAAPSAPAVPPPPSFPPLTPAATVDARAHAIAPPPPPAALVDARQPAAPAGAAAAAAAAAAMAQQPMAVAADAGVRTMKPVTEDGSSTPCDPADAHVSVRMAGAAAAAAAGHKQQEANKTAQSGMQREAPSRSTVLGGPEATYTLDDAPHLSDGAPHTPGGAPHALGVLHANGPALPSKAPCAPSPPCAQSSLEMGQLGAALPQVGASRSESLRTEEEIKHLHILQKEKAAAIQEQLWTIEEKRLGIQERRLTYQLEQEEQMAGGQKEKAGEIKQQLWMIEERKLAIQEERLKLHLQQEA
eukprot:CAMPEP_0202375578 /NCGR_PEP_ID=MMETSP1127-20130417/6234_1 /ASSEMBLY_ACC=CAM_ASM_000462 /TAXON_ID=3047 /ORGANISM="Dunaliella tertiolecta, Strain CCMP1320" /LENGTH=766 /DNA_ID=CAMNT_0048973107 /DNA_START=83 /DNA_END=2383 /DNA_ORIENTATION=+